MSLSSVVDPIEKGRGKQRSGTSLHNTVVPVHSTWYLALVLEYAYYAVLEYQCTARGVPGTVPRGAVRIENPE